MSLQTVFLVINHNQEGSTLYGVFADRETAAACSDRVNKELEASCRELFAYNEKHGYPNLYDTVERCVKSDLSWQSTEVEMHPVLTEVMGSEQGITQ